MASVLIRQYGNHADEIVSIEASFTNKGRSAKAFARMNFYIKFKDEATAAAYQCVDIRRTSDGKFVAIIADDLSNLGQHGRSAAMKLAAVPDRPTERKIVRRQEYLDIPDIHDIHTQIYLYSENQKIMFEGKPAIRLVFEIVAKTNPFNNTPPFTASGATSISPIPTPSPVTPCSKALAAASNVKPKIVNGILMLPSSMSFEDKQEYIKLATATGTNVDFI